MIVKNLLLVGLVAGFATAAAAADEKANWGIGGKVRIDAVQSTTETTDGSLDKVTGKSSEMMLRRAQFKLNGTRANDSVEIKVNADKFGSSDVMEALDSATITHKWSDMLSTSFGKLAALGQSWENDYSSTDQYITSLANEYAPMNANGVQADMSFGDHSISVQALQGMTTDFAGYSYDSKGGLSWTLSYRGEINKMIRPLISYSTLRTAGPSGSMTSGNTTMTVSRGNYATELGAGVQIEAGGATVDLELDTVKLLKQKDSKTEKDTNVQSIIAQVKYPFGSTTALFKFTSDSHKMGADKNVGDMSQTQMALGAEHRLDGNCRLHAVYSTGSATSKGTSNDGNDGDVKVSTNTINFGLTAAM